MSYLGRVFVFCLFFLALGAPIASGVHQSNLLANCGIKLDSPYPVYRLRMVDENQLRSAMNLMVQILTLGVIRDQKQGALANIFGNHIHEAELFLIEVSLAHPRIFFSELLKLAVDEGLDPTLRLVAARHMLNGNSDRFTETSTRETIDALCLSFTKEGSRRLPEFEKDLRRRLKHFFDDNAVTEGLAHIAVISRTLAILNERGLCSQGSSVLQGMKKSIVSLTDHTVRDLITSEFFATDSL